jgi:lipopolysaccharide/colanic/teichoic acid biosynthesis glycosyltransferase
MRASPTVDPGEGVMLVGDRLLQPDHRPVDRSDVSTAVQYRVKRLIDIIVALAVLVLLSPLLLVIALLIRLTSPGPALYRQRRLRTLDQEFTMYKFRTMVDGAEGLVHELLELNQASGPLFKVRSDPRRTPVGRVLRRCFLDELPQFINVLKGEMSLVGPRPCLSSEAAGRADLLAFRFHVPQGITGPWQTSGHHGITFEDQLLVEIDYIENWSLARDVSIILRTIPLVLRRSGI